MKSTVLLASFLFGQFVFATPINKCFKLNQNRQDVPTRICINEISTQYLAKVAMLSGNPFSQTLEAKSSPIPNGYHVILTPFSQSAGDPCGFAWSKEIVVEYDQESSSPAQMGLVKDLTVKLVETSTYDSCHGDWTTKITRYQSESK